MILSAITLQTPFSNPNPNPNPNPNNHNCNLLFCPNSHKLTTTSSLKPTSSTLKPLNATSLRHVTHTLSDDDQKQAEFISSASALASAIRKASTSPVDFIQSIDNNQNSKLVLPSPDFQRLCIEQLDLFRRIVHPDAILSVYVRPAGSYVMDQLELRRVTFYPGMNAADIVILVGNFSIPTGLRVAEATLSNQQVEVVAKQRAVVFPMVKHPFVVGFLVAELPTVEMETLEDVKSEGCESPSLEEAYALSSGLDLKSWEIETFKGEHLRMNMFTAEQRSNAINISRSLAMAYVMDQKAMLLQQSSWQNNARMSNLVEQIRGPLSSIRTLSKMLSIHMKKSEISYDIVEDIMVQGDRMRDTLQKLQDAVYLTKANIMHYNEETLKKMQNSTYAHPESVRSHLLDNLSRDSSSNKMQNSSGPLSLSKAAKDLEMPMPPLALAPVQQNGIRPCNVSDVLADLVEAIRPLAHKQQRVVELSEFTQSLQVAVEEPALRQALSNLIEGALLRTHVRGKVEIVSTGAPAGGVLVVIDDDGPDMHYMIMPFFCSQYGPMLIRYELFSWCMCQQTQTHSLTPFGAELSSENMVEDNMTWNFVAGLTVAREILESYGCVVRVISPRTTDATLGAGGTRVELWLPSFTALSDLNGITQEA